MSIHPSQEWQEELAEADLRRERARQMGGAEALQRTREQGLLNARERLAQLVDPGTMRELGALAGKGSYDEQGRLKEFAPANHVLGLAEVDGRRTVVVADDFTLRGGSSEATVAEKWMFADRYAHSYRVPLVRLVHSAGGSVRLLLQSGQTKIPGYALLPWTALLGMVPVVGVAMGPAAGLGAIRVCCSHFAIMVKGKSQVFAGGPPVVKQAMGIDVDKETLGGVAVHRSSGVIQHIADTEEDALAAARRFLSYLPPNVWQQPERQPNADPVNRCDPWLNDAIPADRRKVYNPRRILQSLFDRDSVFEIAPHFGGSLITAFARLDGHAVGVMINNPMNMGGALTRDAAQKMERFVDVCDTFHLPIVNLVDQPGSMTGTEAEKDGTLGAVLRSQAAIEQSSVPWIAIVIRRCFGLAGGMLSPWVGPDGMALPNRYAWPSARWGSIPIEGGVAAAYKRELEESDDPAARLEELQEFFHRMGSPLRTAERFGVVDVIEPATTRPLLCDWAADAVAQIATQTLQPKGRAMR